MDPVLVTLLALALVVVTGVLFLDRRMARLQAELSQLDALAELADRVKALAAELDRKELSARVQSKITEFTESNRRLTAALTELRQDLDEVRRSSELHSGGGPEVGGGAPDLASVVRDHLSSGGYRRVQLLSDLTELQGLTGRIVFEASKDGAVHKGHVDLRDGAVVEESVRSAYSAFP